MADLKRDLDEYLLLQENQKKNFKIEMPKMPSLPTPDLVGKLFGRNQEPEANSWLKDTQDTCCPKLSRIQRIVGFVTCMGLGIFCMIVSTFYIPVLILKARKFALLYTLGSVFFIMSFSFLSGFGAMFRQMFSRERVAMSISYTCCLTATLYFAMVAQSTALTVLFAVAQIITLLWMILAAIPGGMSGVKFFGSMFRSSVSSSNTTTTTSTKRTKTRARRAFQSRMECDDAAVERQKLVSNDEEDDQNTITNLSSSGQAKSVQTPISPVLSNKLFSSGETSRSQNSTNYSLGKGIANDAPLATKVNYVNERKAQDAKPKAKKIQREPAPTGAIPVTTNASSTATSITTATTTATTVAANTSSSTNSNLPDGGNTLAPPSVPNSNSVTTRQLKSPPSQYQRPKPPDSLPSAASSGVEGGGGGVGGGSGTRLRHPSVHPGVSSTSGSSITLNAKAHNFSSRPLKHHSFISEVPDVRHMERALLGLLEDFHSGKLKAFGSGCTMEQMTSIREQQESLAKLHFDLGTEAFTGGSNNPSNDNELQAQSNMKKLVQKLEQLSFSIEKLHSSNVEK
uniref:Vesicle transport protein n=1 Tax=Anopheles epiroticus TaxID=199890 RepID=A0A182P940_9DIPT